MGSTRCCWQSESMHLLKRFGQGELGLNRIEGFSDGVFAIIVTLLVLEVKVPILHDRSSTSELSNRLVDLVPKFLSWLISFIIVCKLVESSPSAHLRATRDLRNDLAKLDLFDGAGIHPFSDRADGRVSNESAGCESFRRGHGGEHAALHRPAVVHPAKPDQAGDDQRTGAAPYAKIIGRRDFLSIRRRDWLVRCARRVRALRGHTAVLHHAAASASWVRKIME